jgi:hypothetical protein
MYAAEYSQESEHIWWKAGRSAAKTGLGNRLSWGRSGVVFRSQVDGGVGHGNAEPLARSQGVDIGQAVKGGQRLGIETMVPGDAGQCLAGCDVMGTDDERPGTSC